MDVWAILAAGLLGSLVGATSALLVVFRLFGRRLTVVIDHEVVQLGRRVVAEEQRTREAVETLAERLTDATQAWYWTPAWQAGEREADDDLAAGRYEDFTSEVEFDDFLASRSAHAVTR